MNDEEVIELLKKNRQWGRLTKIMKMTGCSYHRIQRLNNIILARKKLKELYFKGKDI